MAVNFSKNQDEITKAWRTVVDSKDTESWALFGYEGTTNNIKLMSTGTNGLAGLVTDLNCSLIQYGFCRVIHQALGINKLILINWQGDSSPLSRKGLCASHVGDVTNYFKGCTQTITIRNDDEATPEYLMEQISKSSSTSRINLTKKFNTLTETTKVGTSYHKTDISSEIPTDRKSFWQRQEEEEKQRIEEERKRADEKQAQFERERKLREESEAKKIAETIKQRDRLIDATRQAERRESSGSQPSSMQSLTKDDDDERVGRRSELIRLERNQETLSLISKGLIKNKRAIFEQASQQQHHQQQQPSQQTSINSMPRKTSGTMVAERLNNLKSLESTSSSQISEKLSNGFAKAVDLNDSNSPIDTSIASETVETTKITNEEAPEPTIVAVKKTPTKLNEVKVENGQKITNGSDSNGNSIHELQDSPNVVSDVTLNDLVHSGKIGIKAKAMFDYEASDDTEISFDPDDIIGFIEKVDSGWWHGSVVTGRFQGQSGLFPANHVEEF